LLIFQTRISRHLDSKWSTPRGKRQHFSSAHFIRTSLILQSYFTVLLSYFSILHSYFIYTSLVLQSYFTVLHSYFSRTTLVLHSYSTILQKSFEVDEVLVFSPCALSFVWTKIKIPNEFNL
jgi:hypothetical protein